MIAFAAGCSSDDGGENWTGGSVIPVALKGIEAVNIDNSGEFPEVTVSPVKKEAYMLGVQWIADNIPTDGGQFITGPVPEGENTFQSIANGYSKAIRCLTQFNDNIERGAYVSSYFKAIDRDYLPAGVNEGFVLLVAPDPGRHAFSVEYWRGSELKFSYDTPVVEFF